MRRLIFRGGAGLAAAGIAALLGYLIQTVSVGGHHPVWPYFLFGVVTVLGAALSLLESRSHSDAALPHASAQVRASKQGIVIPRGISGHITHLQDRGNVEHRQLISGQVVGILADAKPWLLVRPVLDGVFYPQQRVSLDMAGRFRSTVYFGRSADLNRGEEFLLLLILAGLGASKLLDGKLNAVAYIKKLPDDVQILDQRTVFRQ